MSPRGLLVHLVQLFSMRVRILIGRYRWLGRLDPDDFALVIYDFDGVMTDNRIMLTEDGKEGVLSNRADGMGVNLIRERGLDQLILSTEENPVVSRRAEKIGVDVVQGCGDKKQAVLNLVHERKLKLADIIFVGNDINDLAALQICGFSICPSDASKEVLSMADYVTSRAGGAGVIREIAVDLFKPSGG